MPLRPLEARLAPRAKRCAAGFRTSDGGGHHAADAIAADAVARDGEACGIDIELSGMLGDVFRHRIVFLDPYRIVSLGRAVVVDKDHGGVSADRDLANQPVMGGGVAHHPADAVEKKERNLWLTSSSGHYVWIGHHFCYSLKREDFRMVDYQTIAELVNQISVDTWHVLREITQRRPAMMLSELIDCKTRASQQPERQEPRSPTNEPINPG